MGQFTSLTNWLAAQFGALGPILLLGGLGLFLVLAVLPFLLVKPAEPFDKVKSQRLGLGSHEQRGQSGGSNLRRAEKTDRLQRFASFLEPQNSGEMDQARLQMMRAGYRDKNAVRLFNFVQFVAGMGGLVLGGIYAMVTALMGDVTMQQVMMYILCPAALGYYGPKYFIKARVQSRQTEITQGFPDALDLMLVCVEAGQSLDQAINRIAKESRKAYPALSEELEIVAQEVKAGKDRAQVLKEMAHRVDVSDITSFVSALVQSTTFGTSMAEALRTYSAEMRDKRVMRAEERANKLPTKMTIGTMLFTLPPMMIIMVGPSIYDITTSL